MVQLDSLYMVTYYRLKVAHYITLLLDGIQVFKLSDLDFDLARLLKVKCDGVVELPYMVSY